MNSLLYRNLLFLSLLFFSFNTFATIKVAFIRQYDYDQNLVQMEVGGEFSHTLISYKGGWLHVHPYYGVQKIASLEDLTFYHWEAVILSNESLTDLSEETVETYLRLKYDHLYRWEDRESTYCSKLVANLLKIGPTRMNYASDFWPEKFAQFRNTFGISPDDLYAALIETEKFIPEKNCTTNFKKLKHR